MDVVYIETPNEKTFNEAILKFEGLGYKLKYGQNTLYEQSKYIYGIIDSDKNKIFFKGIYNKNKELKINNDIKIGSHSVGGFFGGYADTNTKIDNLKNLNEQLPPDEIEIKGYIYYRGGKIKK